MDSDPGDSYDVSVVVLDLLVLDGIQCKKEG